MLAGLATNLRDALTLGLFFPLRHLSDVAGRAVYPTTVRGAGRVQLRRRSSDASAFRQIFGDREYDLSLFPQRARVERDLERIVAAGKTPVIIDGGANVGAASLFFSGVYPKAQIIAVEPDPDNAEACERNTASRANVTVLRGALGARPGQVDLVNPEGSAWAVQTSRSASGAVRVYTIDEVLETVADAAPLIVKIDIEGFESDLFEENLGWIDRTTMLTIEPHDWLFPDRATSRSFQRVMGERDFDILLSGENLIYIRR